MLWGINNRDGLEKETGQIDRDVIVNTGLIKVRLHIFCFNYGEECFKHARLGGGYDPSTLRAPDNSPT